MYRSDPMLFKPDVIPCRLQKSVHLGTAPGLADKQPLQLINLAPLVIAFVNPCLVPQVSSGVPDISLKCVVSKTFIENIPDQALDEIGGDRFCRLISRVSHLVPQPLQNSCDRFETAPRIVVLRNAVRIILPRPVNDCPPIVRVELRPWRRYIPMALGRAHEPPMFKTRHHVSIDAVGVRVYIKSFLPARDRRPPKISNQGGFHIVLELGICVRPVRMTKHGIIQSFTQRIIGEEGPCKEDADINVAVLADVGTVGIRTLCEYVDAFRTELGAGVDRLANRALGVFSLRLFGSARRTSPTGERLFPITAHIYSCFTPALAGRSARTDQC